METCIIHMENKGYVYVAVEGNINPNKFKELTNKLVDLCSKNNIKKVIFDSSKLSVVNQEGIDWIKKHVIPALSYSSIVKFAFLSPDNPFGELTFSMLITILNSQRVKAFDTMEDAEKWLFTKPKQEATF